MWVQAGHYLAEPGVLCNPGRRTFERPHQRDTRAELVGIMGKNQSAPPARLPLIRGHARKFGRLAAAPGRSNLRRDPRPAF